MMRIATSAAATLLAMLTALPATAQNVWPTEFAILGENLYIRGDLTSATPDQFEDVIDKAPQVGRIVQCEMPGSVDLDAMMIMAYRVRELGLETYLTANSEIASGAVDLFLSGAKRTMEIGARIGIHAWSNGRFEATDYPETSNQHASNRTFVEAMLGSEAFYWFTIRASGFDDVHWMSNAEIKKYLDLSEPPLRRSGPYDCDKAFAYQ